jgi:soluble P-type ATPase
MTKVVGRGKMKKVFKAAMAVSVFASIATGVSVSPAFADDSEVVSRSAKGLSSYQVFQAAGSTLTDGQTLATKLRGADLGVVVIPQSEVATKSAQEIASEVRSSPSVRYSTVIAVIDGPTDTLAVSSSNSEIQKKITSYFGNESVRDAGWVLIQNSSKLVNVEADIKADAEAAANQKANEERTAESVNTFAKFAPLLALLIPILGFFVVAGIRRRKTSNKNDPTRYGFRKMPKTLRTSIASFRKTADLHKDLRRYSLYDPSQRLIARLVELEETMAKIPEKDQRRMILEVEYVERLGKLTEAIGKDYYLSIVEDPTHWEDPNKKLQRVKDAVIALREQILVSIKQINDSSNLEFKIALDSIIGDKNVKVEDLYKK